MTFNSIVTLCTPSFVKAPVCVFSSNAWTLFKQSEAKSSSLIIDLFYLMIPVRNHQQSNYILFMTVLCQNVTPCQKYPPFTDIKM